LGDVWWGREGVVDFVWRVEANLRLKATKIAFFLYLPPPDLAIVPFGDGGIELHARNIMLKYAHKYPLQQCPKFLLFEKLKKREK
jgi:hypothetical protein